MSGYLLNKYDRTYRRCGYTGKGFIMMEFVPPIVVTNKDRSKAMEPHNDRDEAVVMRGQHTSTIDMTLAHDGDDHDTISITGRFE